MITANSAIIFVQYCFNAKPITLLVDNLRPKVAQIRLIIRLPMINNIFPTQKTAMRIDEVASSLCITSAPSWLFAYSLYSICCFGVICRLFIKNFVCAKVAEVLRLGWFEEPQLQRSKVFLGHVKIWYDLTTTVHLISFIENALLIMQGTYYIGYRGRLHGFLFLVIMNL